MTDPAPPSPTSFRTGGLSPRKPTRFSYAPNAEARAALASELGLLGLHAMQFRGEITPVGRDEMVLTAQLTAVADQSCIVTLVPVRSRVDEAVRRRFIAGLAPPDGEEVEMPEDDTTEPMPEVIDTAAIAAEALMLALPLYPRAPGAELGVIAAAPEGVVPLSDADLKPFAGLAALAGKLTGKIDPEDGNPG